METPNDYIWHSLVILVKLRNSVPQNPMQGCRGLWGSGMYMGVVLKQGAIGKETPSRVVTEKGAYPTAILETGIRV